MGGWGKELKVDHQPHNSQTKMFGYKLVLPDGVGFNVNNDAKAPELVSSLMNRMKTTMHDVPTVIMVEIIRIAYSPTLSSTKDKLIRQKIRIKQRQPVLMPIAV